MEEYLNISGSEKITELYGGWPSFHDAEVISVLLDRGKERGKFGPTVTIKVHCFSMTSELDENGCYKIINHAQITLKFLDVVEFSLTHGFGTQNSLSGMYIEDIRTHQLEGINYKVSFGAHLNCDIEFKCSEIDLISLEMGIPIESIYE